MKSILISILGCIFAVSLSAAPVKPCEIFTVEPSAASVKAGTVLTLQCQVKCQNGYELKGISASVQRRMAPAEFFAAAGVNVKYYNKNNPAKKSPYDHVLFFNDIFPKTVADGSAALKLDTAGMMPGDYAVALRGYFTKKGAKAVYSNIFLALTIENDAAPKAE